MTHVIKAKPPKAYNCSANIPVGVMFKLYGLLLPLALKPATGIRADDCGWLTNMMKKKKGALHVVISNIGGVPVVV